MNRLRRIYCRTFQKALRLLLPILPYRNPIMIEKIEEIPQVCIKNNKKAPLIVTDRNLYALGLTKTLEESLSENQISYAVYQDVTANPTTDQVEKGREVYLKNQCDCLIAFGGGSPMDCAKGIGARIARPKKSLNQMKGLLKIRKKIPLLIAIPTTAGTGSETTLAAVIVDSKTRYKYAINDFVLIPSYAILDSEVTKSLPPQVVSTTGMDALTHAIEAYIGKSGNRQTRKEALFAMKLIFENLEETYLHPQNDSARKEMLLAAHYAGRAFSKAYVGYVHALAHALGGKYDIPHGLANAVILPYVLKAYGSKIEKKLSHIAENCGFDIEGKSVQETAQMVIDRIEKLNRTFHHPTHLHIEESDLDELSHDADIEANPLYPVPVLWNRNQLKEILSQIGTEQEKK